MRSSTHADVETALTLDCHGRLATTVGAVSLAEIRVEGSPSTSVAAMSAVEGLDFEEEAVADAPGLGVRGMTVAFKVVLPPSQSACP